MTILPKTATVVCMTLLALVMSARPANSQRIVLIQKNYAYHNIGTGLTTGDWVHYFLIEGETTPHKAGYFVQHLKKFVQSDTQAVKYINSYATRQTLKLITTVSTVVLFSAFAISNLSKESVSQQNLDSPDKNKGLLYASIGTFAINVLLRTVPPRSIRKAVDSYNNSLDKKTISFNGFFIKPQRILNRRTLAVGLRFDFDRQ